MSVRPLEYDPLGESNRELDRLRKENERLRNENHELLLEVAYRNLYYDFYTEQISEEEFHEEARVFAKQCPNGDLMEAMRQDMEFEAKLDEAVRIAREKLKDENEKDILKRNLLN